MAKLEVVHLRNIARNPRRPVIVHLSHEEVCANIGECWCERRRVGVISPTPHEQTGKPRVLTMLRRFPDTLHLCASGTEGDTEEGLPLGILFSSDLQAKGKAHLVEVKRVFVDVPDGAAAGADQKPAAKAVSPKADKPSASSAGDPAGVKDHD